MPFIVEDGTGLVGTRSGLIQIDVVQANPSMLTRVDGDSWEDDDTFEVGHWVELAGFVDAANNGQVQIGALPSDAVIELVEAAGIEASLVNETGDEDFTSLTRSKATAYITEAFGTDYHLDRGNEQWADADSALRQVSIIRASQYLDNRFCFVGTRVLSGQGLDWPRSPAYDRDGFDRSNEVPAVVQQACAEYALQVLLSGTAVDLMPVPTDPDDSGHLVTMKREKVGPIEEETRYSDSRGRSIIKPYPLADRILVNSGLVVVTGNRAIRA